MKPTWELQEVHVDWLTATSPTGPSGIDLFDLGARILAQEAERGNPCRPSNFEGYHGSLSQSCFVGWRLDGAIVRIGGRVARDRWRDVVGQAANITRMDLAVTAKCSPPDPSYPCDCWDELPTTRSGSGREPEYSLIQSRHGGATLYCGRRASERFGRIYDKHRESRGQYPDGTFRYEVEYKGQSAKEVAAYLKEGTDTVPRILGVVRRRMQDWGVLLPVSDPGIDWRPPPFDIRTDNESRMKWLREGVRSSLEKVGTSYTADEIRAALGLQFGTEAAYEADDPHLEILRRARAEAAGMTYERWKKEHPKDDRGRTKPDDDSPSASGNPVKPRPSLPTQSAGKHVSHHDPADEPDPDAWTRDATGRIVRG